VELVANVRQPLTDVQRPDAYEFAHVKFTAGREPD
jgi:hypothetical protein